MIGTHFTKLILYCDYFRCGKEATDAGYVKGSGAEGGTEKLVPSKLASHHIFAPNYKFITRKY